MKRNINDLQTKLLNLSPDKFARVFMITLTVAGVRNHLDNCRCQQSKDFAKLANSLAKQFNLDNEDPVSRNLICKKAYDFSEMCCLRNKEPRRRKHLASRIKKIDALLRSNNSKKRQRNELVELIKSIAKAHHFSILKTICLLHENPELKPLLEKYKTSYLIRLCTPHFEDLHKKRQYSNTQKTTIRRNIIK